MFAPTLPTPAAPPEPTPPEPSKSANAAKLAVPIVIGIIAFLIIGSILQHRKPKQATPAAEAAQVSVPVKPTPETWDISTTLPLAARSARRPPGPPMQAPYSNITANIAVVCDLGRLAAAVVFNGFAAKSGLSPSSMYPTTGPTRVIVPARIGWNDHAPQHVSAVGRHHGTSNYIQMDGLTPARLAAESSVTIAFDLSASHDQPSVIFRWSLDGSSKAITAARAACR